MATIAELLKKLKDGTATQKDLQEYAALLGLESGSQVAEAILESSIDGEELYQLSTQQLHGDYLKISDFADTLQNASYEAEGLSLRAIRPEFSTADVREVLAKIAQKETVTKEFIASEIGLVSQKVADRHMQANAEAANNVGLQAMVSREYVSGGFGEHTTSKHPKTCSFCWQRATRGKALPYTEAYSKGVFQRHPNCRCIIIYTNTAGKTTYQAAKGAWIELQDRQTLINRKEYNLSETIVQSGGKLVGGHHYKATELEGIRGEQAAKAYEKYSRVDDSDIIAKNTGFSREDILTIRRHIFFDKHETYNGYERFEADYNMAVAWKRLQNGEQLPRDIMLLNHELLEHQLEVQYNLSAAEAHAKAIEKYDWWQQVVYEIGEQGEPDGLL